MHKYAIIVAGGTGTRMGGELPKQFQLLKRQAGIMVHPEGFYGCV